MRKRRKHAKCYILLSLAVVLVYLIVFGSMYAEYRREAPHR